MTIRSCLRPSPPSPPSPVEARPPSPPSRLKGGAVVAQAMKATGGCLNGGAAPTRRDCEVAMGMFDSFKPSRPLTCPACGLALRRWQGKDGPCVLFVWREGVASPIDQELDEVDEVDEDIRALIPDRERQRLPKTFTIYSYECPRHQPVGRSPLSARPKMTYGHERRCSRGGTERTERVRASRQVGIRFYGFYGFYGAPRRSHNERRTRSK